MGLHTIIPRIFGQLDRRFKVLLAARGKVFSLKREGRVQGISGYSILLDHSHIYMELVILLLLLVDVLILVPVFT
ncbi:MAG: hypothetical protein QXT67_04490 [Candidatus Bathyarchaeia archaeon]